MIEEWVSRPENTARTVLVTIFGDTIEPVTPSVWLAQLFRLTDALGFNERLVRTSMTRLVAEGWLDNERIGRQSRYALTDPARRETLDAESRIYHRDEPDWSGRWTVVLLDTADLDTAVRDQVSSQLGWHGFVPLSRGILASPTVDTTRARRLCASVVDDGVIPTATMEFSELDELADRGFFTDLLRLDEVAETARAFLAFHERAEQFVDDVDPASAFALRTMLIHDLRRLRLRSIDPPPALLPPDWPGDAAFDLAARFYDRLVDRSTPWIADVLEVDDASGRPVRFGPVHSTTPR